eukprot:gene8280-biopygen1624
MGGAAWAEQLGRSSLGGAAGTAQPGRRSWDGAAGTGQLGRGSWDGAARASRAISVAGRTHAVSPSGGAPAAAKDGGWRTSATLRRATLVAAWRHGGMAACRQSWRQGGGKDNLTLNQAVFATGTAGGKRLCLAAERRRRQPRLEAHAERRLEAGPAAGGAVVGGGGGAAELRDAPERRLRYPNGRGRAPWNCEGGSRIATAPPGQGAALWWAA